MFGQFGYFLFIASAILTGINVFYSNNNNLSTATALLLAAGSLLLAKFCLDERDLAVRNKSTWIGRCLGNTLKGKDALSYSNIYLMIALALVIVAGLSIYYGIQLIM
jgi:hypothetical protein